MDLLIFFLYRFLSSCCHDRTPGQVPRCTTEVSGVSPRAVCLGLDPSYSIYFCGASGFQPWLTCSGSQEGEQAVWEEDQEVHSKPAHWEILATELGGRNSGTIDEKVEVLPRANYDTIDERVEVSVSGTICEVAGILLGAV